MESVIPAGSAYIGQSLAGSEFRTKTGLNALALSRHGSLQLRRLQETPLEIGDTLLIQGHLRDIARARREREVLMLDEVQAPAASHKSWVVLITLLLVLLGAALTSQPLAILGLAGAMALVLTRVVAPDEVPRVIDFKVIVPGRRNARAGRGLPRARPRPPGSPAGSRGWRRTATPPTSSWACSSSPRSC